MRRFLPLLRRRAQTATHKRELGRSAKPFASGNENPCHRRRRHYLCRLLINVSSRLLHVPNHPEITRCAEMKHWSYKPVYYHGQDVLPRQAYRERRGCWGQLSFGGLLSPHPRSVRRDRPPSIYAPFSRWAPRQSQTDPESRCG